MVNYQYPLLITRRQALLPLLVMKNRPPISTGIAKISPTMGIMKEPIMAITKDIVSNIPPTVRLNIFSDKHFELFISTSLRCDC